MALAIDPQTPSHLYCGVYRGGIYKSVDSGETWVSVNPALREQVVSAIAIDPKHPDTVFVGAEIGGLFRTIDGGTTWTDISPVQEFISSIAIDPVHTDTVYVGTLLDGVFKSRDGGATWLSVSSGLGEAWVESLSIDPSEPTHLFASTAYGPGVFRSLNGGGSWTPAVGLPDEAAVYGIAIDPRSPATIYAGVDRGQYSDADVYRSTDNGSTWTPTGLGASAYSLQATPNGVYAATNRGIWKIRNGTDHWVAVNGDVESLIAYAIGVNPEDAAVIHVGAIGGVFRTTDGGAHWHASSEGIRHTEVWAVATDPRDPATVYAGTIGAGVAKSRDAGQSWTPSGPGLTQPFVTSLAIDPTLTSTVFAGTERDLDGDAFKSTDGGASWRASGSEPIGSAVLSVAVDPANPLTTYAGAWPGVFRSDDGGLHWNLVGQQFGPMSVKQIVFDPVQTSTVYAAAYDRGVVKSIDRGDHWTFLTGGYPSSLAIDPTNPQVLYAGSYPDLLRKTTNGGGSWESIGEALEGHLRQVLGIVVDPEDSQTLYVAGWDGVFRSSNGGASWTDLEIPGIAIIQALTLDGAGAFLHAGTWTNGVMSYQLHFLDATASHPFRADIETVALAGISSGCGAGRFCPEASLTRAQASVWLLRAMHGAAYPLPPATGAVFPDVPADAFAAAFIEQVAAEGVTSGCGAEGFCPNAPTTRAQIAVWLLRAKNGPTYAPPPATGIVFADVPADAFAADWIEALASAGITSGCGGGNYCPADAIIRGQAAALLVKTFELE